MLDPNNLLTKFINENKFPETKEELFKFVVDYNYDRFKRSCTCCALCNKELTPEDEKFFSKYHFHRMCKEHIEYADHFLLDRLKVELGYPKY